jgi:hypothetical protein
MQLSESLHRLRRLAANTLRRPSSGATEQAARDNDLSYEDALLDIQLRNFFKAEYGAAQPPSGVFPRLLAAIRAHERGEEPSGITGPVAAFMSLYRVLQASSTQRLVSGAVTAALLVAVLSSNSVHFLTGTAVSFVDSEVSPTPSAAVQAKSDFDLATNRKDRYVNHLSDTLPYVASEPAFYDPVERRVPQRDDLAANNTPARWLRLSGQ